MKIFAQIDNYKNEFYFALKIRVTEYKLIELYNSGEVSGTVHTSVGQEIIPVLLYRYLNKHDWIFSNHRGHAHFLAKTNDYFGLISEVLGRKCGVSSGIGGSQHLFSNAFIANGIQGGMTPIAVGVALYNKISTSGFIAVCHIGDGTMGQGVIYEAFNLASIWKVPILFVIEDNGIAQSTPALKTLSGSIENRFKAFGIKYFLSTSDDWEELDKNCKNSIEYVRSGMPAALHIKTNRLLAHSKGDDNRPVALIDDLNSKDPINCLLREFPWALDLQYKIQKELNDIAKRALESQKQDCSPHWNSIFRESIKFESYISTETEKVLTQITSAIEQWLSKCPNALKIGEDIVNMPEAGYRPYGGAFKVTGDISDRYRERVLGTPISEAAIVGCATGVAIAGGRSSVEIMFGDFSTLIIDQLLQHACKFMEMFGRKIPIPLNIRTPMGGRRGYGATHSQSLEHHFIRIPNLNVFSPNHRLNIGDLYANIYSLDEPTFVAEHKLGYYLDSKVEMPQEYYYLVSDEKFPTIICRPVDNSPEFTVFTYGYGLFLAEKALALLAEKRIWVEIICPSRLNPINADPVLKSLLKTKRFVGFEEGSANHGLAASMLSYLNCEGVFPSGGAILLGNDSYIPAASAAEKDILPDENILFERVVQALGEHYA